MVCGRPILRLRREKLLYEAERILRSPEAARAWLKTANEALGGQSPEALLDTLDGFEQALAVLEDQTSEPGQPG
jgi:uncharacterized protein (DUF2384 family)